MPCPGRSRKVDYCNRLAGANVDWIPAIAHCCAGRCKYGIRKPWPYVARKPKGLTVDLSSTSRHAGEGPLLSGTVFAAIHIQHRAGLRLPAMFAITHTHRIFRHRAEARIQFWISAVKPDPSLRWDGDRAGRPILAHGVFTGELAYLLKQASTGFSQCDPRSRQNSAGDGILVKWNDRCRPCCVP